MINFGNLPTVSVSWDAFCVATKQAGLDARVQYDADPVTYTVYTFNGVAVVYTTIWRGVVPDSAVNQGYTQAENDANKLDFETNYLALANQPGVADAHVRLPVIQQNGAAAVVISAREGAEVIYATHNMSDPTTWYGDSTRVVKIKMKDAGDGLVWTPVDTGECWIDMTHGKIYDEDAYCQDQKDDHPEDPHGFALVVRVDGQELTEREAFEASGGDYLVNYATRKITFFTTQAGRAVEVDASVKVSSGWYLYPAKDKKFVIEAAEIQFSEDSVMTDTLVLQIFGRVDVFAPQYSSANGGPIPAGTSIVLQTTQYKTLDQILDEAYGVYPVLPKCGGDPRGFNSTRIVVPFRYGTARELSYSTGMFIRTSTKHDRPFGGERATATFYATSVSE